MTSIEDLKKFVVERLTAAAEEIFGVFQQTIDEYEEEIDRQRRLLLVVRQPVIKLHRKELPEQLICKEEDVLTDQQLCNQERNFSLDQEDPEPPHIKEEEEELYSSHDGEQLLLTQETDAFILTPILEENVRVGDQNLELNPFDILDRSIVSMPVLSSVVSDPNTDLQLLSNSFHVAEIKDQIEGEHEVCGSTEDAEAKQKKLHHKNKRHTKKVCDNAQIRSHCDTDTGKTTFECKICGKDFKHLRYLTSHMKVHTGEKPFACDTCGKTFRQKENMLRHTRIHTGERPFVCGTCGKLFSQSGHLSQHMTIHTGERPYVCKICGKFFSQSGTLSKHMRIHMDMRPYDCTTCGRGFKQRSHLVNHMKLHRDDKP